MAGTAAPRPPLGEGQAGEQPRAVGAQDGIGLGDPVRPVRVQQRGPTLSTGGIVDYLRNPTLELYAANGSLVATNDKWPNSADKDAIIATELAPPSYYESAILKSLAPGAYSVILRGGPDLPPPSNTGIGLVEVYEVPTR